jgi:hypothetical protein
MVKCHVDINVTPEDALPVTLHVIQGMLQKGIFRLKPLGWDGKTEERREKDRARRKRLQESNRESKIKTRASKALPREAS